MPMSALWRMRSGRRCCLQVGGYLWLFPCGMPFLWTSTCFKQPQPEILDRGIFLKNFETPPLPSSSSLRNSLKKYLNFSFPCPLGEHLPSEKPKGTLSLELQSLILLLRRLKSSKWLWGNTPVYPHWWQPSWKPVQQDARSTTISINFKRWS